MTDPTTGVTDVLDAMTKTIGLETPAFPNRDQNNESRLGEAGRGPHNPLF